MNPFGQTAVTGLRFLGKCICYKPVLKTFSDGKSVVQNDLKFPESHSLDLTLYCAKT